MSGSDLWVPTVRFWVVGPCCLVWAWVHIVRFMLADPNCQDYS